MRIPNQPKEVTRIRKQAQSLSIRDRLRLLKRILDDMEAVYYFAVGPYESLKCIQLALADMEDSIENPDKEEK